MLQTCGSLHPRPHTVRQSTPDSTVCCHYREERGHLMHHRYESLLPPPHNPDDKITKSCGAARRRMNTERLHHDAPWQLFRTPYHDPRCGHQSYLPFHCHCTAWLCTQGWSRSCCPWHRLVESSAHFPIGQKFCRCGGDWVGQAGKGVGSAVGAECGMWMA